MKKISFIILILILLTSCSAPLSEDFDEKIIEDNVHLIIDHLNNKATDKLFELSTVTLKNELTEETMAQVYELLKEGGKFEEITSISNGSTVDKNTKEEFAVSIIKTQYELKEFSYTMTFTKQYKLAGLFIK